MVSSANHKKKTPFKERIGVIDLIKGIIISYIITVPVFFIFAVLLANTDFPEKYIRSVVIATTIISVLIAGSVVTHRLKSKGWLNGGFVGFIYMFVIYIFSSLLFKDFSVNRYIITVFIIGILTGSVGGILGINLRKNSKIKSR